MSTNFQPPPMPPQGPPPGPPPSNAGGHGAFSAADIQEIMAATGMSYEEVCAAIDQSGATNKEQLAQALQSAPAPETVAPGMVQGQPPPVVPGPEGSAMLPAGAPVAGAEPVEGISPEVAQAMHDQMSPAAKYRRTRK